MRRVVVVLAILGLSSPHPSEAVHPKRQDLIVSESQGTATIWVEPHCPPATSEVRFRTEDSSALAGDDYTSVSGTLKFEPGGPQRQSFQVPIVGDSAYEREEIFRIVLRAVGVDACGGGGMTVEESVTILDDDPPSSPDPNEPSTRSVAPGRTEVRGSEPARAPEPQAMAGAPSSSDQSPAASSDDSQGLTSSARARAESEIPASKKQTESGIWLVVPLGLIVPAALWVMLRRTPAG